MPSQEQKHPKDRCVKKSHPDGTPKFFYHGYPYCPLCGENLTCEHKSWIVYESDIGSYVHICVDCGGII